MTRGMLTLLISIAVLSAGAWLKGDPLCIGSVGLRCAMRSFWGRLLSVSATESRPNRPVARQDRTRTDSVQIEYGVVIERRRVGPLELAPARKEFLRTSFDGFSRTLSMNASFQPVGGCTTKVTLIDRRMKGRERNSSGTVPEPTIPPPACS